MRRWVRTWAVSFIAAATSQGCGGTSDGDGGETLTGADAVAGCGRLVDGVCSANERCGSTLTRDECEADVRVQGLDCSRAQSVGPALEQCLDDLETVGCTSSTLPDSCRDLVLLGPEEEVPTALSGCFVPSAETDTCDAYCATQGQSCESTCAIWEGLPPDFAGIDWMEAGLCPASPDEGLAVPSCDSPISISVEARCCCTE